MAYSDCSYLWFWSPNIITNIRFLRLRNMPSINGVFVEVYKAKWVEISVCCRGKLYLQTTFSDFRLGRFWTNAPRLKSRYFRVPKSGAFFYLSSVYTQLYSLIKNKWPSSHPITSDQVITSLAIKSSYH